MADIIIYDDVAESEEARHRFIEQLKKDWNIREGCAICSFPLTTKYPDDYPDEWKFCCSCFKWARRVIRTEDDAYVSIEYMKSMIKESPILKKLLEKITLVKGNGIIRKYCQ